MDDDAPNYWVFTGISLLPPLSFPLISHLHPDTPHFDTIFLATHLQNLEYHCLVRIGKIRATHTLGVACQRMQSLWKKAWQVLIIRAIVIPGNPFPWSSSFSLQIS